MVNLTIRMILPSILALFFHIICKNRFKNRKGRVVYGEDRRQWMHINKNAMSKILYVHLQCIHNVCTKFGDGQIIGVRGLPVWETYHFIIFAQNEPFCLCVWFFVFCFCFLFFCLFFTKSP
jgi:hypothetical protein